MAREIGFWKKVGTYITPVFTSGVDFLVRGTNKYINFNSLTGESGYGIRDNNGTIEVKSSGGSWSTISTGGGEANTAANLGAGTGIFESKVGVELRFKSLVAGTGMGISSDGTTVTLTATSGSGDVVGPASAVDNNIVTFDTTTGKLVQDGGATIAQVRDRSTHTGTQTASTISDFDTEVSNNTDVAANTSARHAAVTKAGTGTYVSLSGQEITVDPIEVSDIAASSIVTEAEGIASNDNDTTIPTSAAVKDYVDNNAGGTVDVVSNVATSTILGRVTAGAGDSEELTATQVRALLNVEDNADVTDAGNVGAVNAAAASKATPVDADSFPIVDSEAANVIKRLTFTNLKAFLKTYFDTVYQAAGSYLTSVTAGDVNSEAATDGYVLTADGAGNAAWEAVPAGGGDVSKVGTPANNQIGVWTGDGTIEGTSNLTYNGTDFYVVGNLGASGSFVASSGLTVGAGIAAGTVTSNASQDLILKTGNATTGTITITDGVNGNINIAPNGAGEAQVNGEKIIDETDTASDTVAGIVELATTAETNTGTDATRAVTPDALAGSYAGTKSVAVMVFDATTDTATGDGKAYFTIPSAVGGMNLVAVHARVITAGTTGTTDIQIHNVTQAADMLSTKLTIDSGETGSDTAATAAVIDTANDDVATNDLLRIDVDAVSTTAAQGLIVTCEFRLP